VEADGGLLVVKDDYFRRLKQSSCQSHIKLSDSAFLLTCSVLLEFKSTQHNITLVMLSRQKIKICCTVSRVFHISAQYFVFKMPGSLVYACKFLDDLMQKIRLDPRKHLFTSHILMGQKPPLKSWACQTQLLHKKS
jgi:hypothetical protein